MYKNIQGSRRYEDRTKRRKWALHAGEFLKQDNDRCSFKNFYGLFCGNDSPWILFSSGQLLSSRFEIELEAVQSATSKQEQNNPLYAFPMQPQSLKRYSVVKN